MSQPPKYSISGIFIDNKNWDNYKVNHPGLDSHIIREVERMLDCCNPKKGFFLDTVNIARKKWLCICVATEEFAIVVEEVMSGDG